MSGEYTIDDIKKIIKEMSLLYLYATKQSPFPVGIMAIMKAILNRVDKIIQTVTTPFKNLVEVLPNTSELGVCFHDRSALWQVFRNPSLGMGESYMQSKWDHLELDRLYENLLSKEGHSSIFSLISNTVFKVRGYLQNFQDKEGARKVIEEHYDLPTDIYEKFLDPFLQYTCGFFSSPDISDIEAPARLDGTISLEQAQINKMERICQKLNLKSGDRVLDIGGGWGGLAKYAVEQYGVSVDIVTLSGVQADYAESYCEGKDITIHRCDYRDMIEKLGGKTFNKVVSVGMLEHIGHKNIDHLFLLIGKVLESGGTGLLHCIYSLEKDFMRDPFVEKYIFPNGEIISGQIIGRNLKKYFTFEDKAWGIEDWGMHYDPTLMAWNERFKQIEGLDIQEKRKWEAYFCSMAAGFRVGRMSVGQWVFYK